MAAFIDLERGDAAVAAERYPAVWWHLWLCADCAEVYSLTCELLAAETSRTHRRQLTATPAIFWLPRIVIEREVLKVMLPRRFDSMLVARGDDTRHALFDETLDTKAACLCTVWAQQLDDDRYRIDIELVPPLARTAVLRCGELLLHADFSSRGRAMLGPVPANLLEADAGPDLEIRCLGLTQ